MEFFIARTKLALRIVLLFVILLQMIFFGGLEVLAGCVVSFISLLMYEHIVLRPEVLRKHPVAFLALTGMVKLIQIGTKLMFQMSSLLVCVIT